MKINWITVGFAIIAFFLYVFSCNQVRTVTELDNLLDAKNDSLRHYQTDGVGVAKKLVYVTNPETLKKLADKDSLILLLQAKLNKRTVSGTVASTQTHTSHGTGNAEKDTTGSGMVLEGNVSDTLPTYLTTYSDQWEQYSVVATSDSIYLDHTSFNKFSITQEWKKQGKGLKAFFNPKVLEVSIYNDNPNTVTLDAESFHIPQKNPRTLTVLGLGFGIGALSVLLLK